VSGYKFRPNVAVFVLNQHGEILTCERYDRPRAWQIPQGGIDRGESPEDALRRELKEEIGTNSGVIIDKLPRKIRYDWPEELWRDGFCGQEQTYFLFEISKKAKIDLSRGARLNQSIDQEFRDFKFLGAESFLKLIKGFKREAYIKALTAFNKRAPGIIAR